MTNSNGSLETDSLTQDESGSEASGISSNDAKTPAESMSEAEKADAVASLLRGDQPASSEDGKDPEASQADQGRDPWMPESGQEGQDGSDGGQGGKSGDGAQRPTTLNEAAENLGLSPEEAYKLELTTRDGEAITVGELKDAWHDREDAARENVQRSADLDEREAALIADRQLVTGLVDTLRDQVPQEALQGFMEDQQRIETVERERLLEAMPELKDQEASDAFKVQLAETLGRYFEPHELKIMDHRQVLIVRDLIRAESRLKKLLSYKPQKDPPNTVKSNGRGKPGSKRQQVMNRARAGSEADKVAGVHALISGN